MSVSAAVTLPKAIDTPHHKRCKAHASAVGGRGGPRSPCKACRPGGHLVTGWGFSARPTSKHYPAGASDAFRCHLTRPTRVLGPTRISSRPQRSRSSHS